jgi:hypothetical protein
MAQSDGNLWIWAGSQQEQLLQRLLSLNVRHINWSPKRLLHPGRNRVRNPFHGYDRRRVICSSNGRHVFGVEPG